MHEGSMGGGGVWTKGRGGGGGGGGGGVGEVGLKWCWEYREGVYLFARLPAISLQAKIELFHTFFSRILARC